jgi:excisionase family DNA binding protein
VSAKSAIIPEFITLQEAAARTGFSVFTFRRLINEGQLPGYRLNDKPGSAIRVKRSDVDALLKPVIPSGVYADRDGGA